jgi:mRNA interferase MazF
MKRGDVVIVAATGDYGKPRAAVIVQTDAFPETHASVVICQMTSEIVDGRQTGHRSAGTDATIHRAPR